MRNQLMTSITLVAASVASVSSAPCGQHLLAEDHLALQRPSQQQKQSPGWAPLRIEWVPGSISALPAGDQSFLLDELIPHAVRWLHAALAVRPWDGVLRAARSCSERFDSTGKCAKEGPPPVCGIAAGGGGLSIPSDLLDSLEVCTSCSRFGSCSGCSSSAAGEGAEADFVLIVSAVATEACSDGVLAYAGTCQRDRFDRPIFGQANFCPGALSSAPQDLDAQVATAVHELVHALGFSHASWALWCAVHRCCLNASARIFLCFLPRHVMHVRAYLASFHRRHEDGTPRTPRGRDGLPPLVDATCFDGITRKVRKPSPSTLVVAAERGLWVNRIVTPRVVSVARELFNCTSLTGVELETEPESAGHCYGSHWEQSFFPDEFLAPRDAHVSINVEFSSVQVSKVKPIRRTALTLAALEDSGWYKANYSLAEPFEYGRGSGCDFVAGLQYKRCLRELRVGRASHCDLPP